jgi:hypothetical protein
MQCKSITDTVEFTRKGLTNQLRLVKYFAQTSTAS